MSTKLRIAVCVLLIFAAGGVTGFFLGKRAGRRAESIAEAEARSLAELSDLLKLTPQQQDTVRAALADWGKGARDIQSRQAREKLALFNSMSARIRAALNPAQQPAFDQHTAPLRTRLERWAAEGELK